MDRDGRLFLNGVGFDPMPFNLAAKAYAYLSESQPRKYQGVELQRLNGERWETVKADILV